MLRTLSMPVWSVRRSTPRSFSKISGTLSRVKPRSSICCRVVISNTLLPSRRESSAMVRSCSLLAKPLGMRMRIMNLPGVGLRKNTPIHFNNSFSAGVSASAPRSMISGRSSRMRRPSPFIEAL